MKNSQIAPTFSSLAALPTFANEYCLDFDGVDEYLNWGKDPSLCGAGTVDFTISVWINVPSVPDTGDAVFQRGVWNNSGIYLRKEAGPVLQFSGYGWSDEIKVNFDATNTNANEIWLNTWHHIAITFVTSTAERILYLDGVNVDDKSVGTLTFTANQDDVSFIVGGVDGVAGGPFRGKIDEVAWWNSALPVADILEVFGDAGGSGGRGNGKVVDLTDLPSAAAPTAWLRMGDLGTFSGVDPNGQWLIPEYSNAI